ncbi:hypothetical protein ASG43_03220 [Aureimonas sp. Leaf454]|uniref:YdcH family protein n=1 Tax=Aureimonas sp. Leaf454 TaxID=1736381 RepID=UPI0006F30121|nr:YdcH family protein [Aureimonas sp. Leaf454]KQT54610.1 hypothetical protein ASG43_03220 [Aureimonas sp. Leaf454]
MTQDGRIERLERQRQDLKEKIVAESGRRYPDQLAIRRMKLMKCQLKDQVALLRRRISASAAA